MIRRMIVCCIILGWIGGCGEDASDASERSLTKYRPGQTWTYHTRPGEESSRAIILKVERDKRLSHIIHLRIEGVRIKNAQNPEQLAGVVVHMPLSQEAVDRSVIDLITTDATLPDYQEMYHVWRQAYDDGKVKLLAPSIADQINDIEKRLIQ